MKRLGNLYEQTYQLENILDAFNEVYRNTKNKRRINQFRDFKCIYVYRIYTILKNRQYVVVPYNKFTIHEPKERHIVSQRMQDKIINHIVSRCILHLAILPCLINENVASRKGLGTKHVLKLLYDYQRKCKIKYGTYYILKCDISNFLQVLTMIF